MRRHKLINSKSVRIDGSEFSEMCHKLAGVPIEGGELFIPFGNARVKCPHVWYPDEVEKNRKNITDIANRMLKNNGHNVEVTINFPDRFEDIPDEEVESTKTVTVAS